MLISVTHVRGEAAIGVLIYVPIFYDDATLDLYKYENIPWITSKSWKHGSIRPKIKETMMSIDPISGAHQVLDPSSLDRCHLVRNIYICDEHRSFYKEYNASCLGAIFSHDFDAMNRKCEMALIEPSEYVNRITNGVYRMMLPNSTMYKLDATATGWTRFTS